MVALSLWKVLRCWNFVTLMDGILVIWKVVRFWDFVTLMDGSLVIMEGSLLSIFLLLQGLVAMSL